MEKILQSYLRRLTNLSGNNRSLLLQRLVADQFLDIHDLDFALNRPSFELINGLISGTPRLPLCEEMDSRDAKSNTVSRKLKRIQRVDQFIFEERGAKDLYVGWPFVQGKFSDGAVVRCPLIFFPVELKLINGKWELLRRKDVNTTLNKTFLLAYAYYNQVSLDEDLIEQVIDDYDNDSVKFRTQLYELLRSSKVEMNFNTENFTDQLKPFIDLRKDQLESSERDGELKMHPHAVLGIFPQAGSYLVPDYIQLLEKKPAVQIENFFSQAVQESNTRFSDLVREENTFTPFRIDAYQEHALAQIKRGQSLVIQGPPGSGKSQLISNLVCDFIARGKNVLLVCQKRAALDVVWERLRSKGLTDFVGLVHDFKNDRKVIYDQITRQIESLDEYETLNNGLDTIYLERQFQQSSRKLDQLSEELLEFKEALFDEGDCGKSVKELYLTSSPERPSVALNQEYRAMTYNDVPDFENRLGQFLDYFQQLEAGDNFWINGVSFSNFSVKDLTRLKEILGELEGFQKWIEECAIAFTKQKIDYETVVHFQSKREKFDDLLEDLSDEKVYQKFKNVIAKSPKNPLETLLKLEQSIISCFKGAGPEISLPFDQLGRFQEALESAIKARKGLFSWLKWKLTSADKVFITRVLVANDLKSDKEGFEVLLDRIDNRLNLEHFISEMQEHDWMENFPVKLRKIDIQNWFFTLKEAVKAYKDRNDIRSLPEFIAAPEFELDAYRERILALMHLLDEVPERTSKWHGYLTDSQLRALMMGKIGIEEASKHLNRDFDSIVEFHKLKEGFTTNESDIVSKLIDGFVGKEQTLALFKNSLALAWIDHIETKYPILRSVSSKKLDHMVGELQQANREKRIASRDILLMKSRERTYEGVEYNRLNNRTTYRDLHHQVTKKRRIWPIRRVISAHSEELFNLLPCWMASPESASAIFPMEKFFDLVIFDEASQCFSERGLPAMYRGHQVVIAGDDQQLQPNDLYRVRWDENNEEDLPELEIDSLLDLAKKYVPEISLQGHYRSRSLQLIEFSNERFYNGKLKMLPHYEVANEQEPSIHYVKVEGIWEDNVNDVEAIKVVELVQKILNESVEKSIAIVTFNAKQQNHLMDVLEEAAIRNGFIVPDDLIVKNIENIQGDERDIVIFSTAYGPDKKGKLRLQFGSLNQKGGENRLNVAVTRAKEEIYLVTSIHPNELNTKDTKNPGPKYLQEYLEYAYSISSKKWKPAPLRDESRGQDWYLRSQLPPLVNEANLKLEKDHPYSDLTLSENGRYKALVFTDDDLYHDTLSPKQAYAYQVSHLSEKKWESARIYSREFWMDRATVVDRLEKLIKRVS